MDRTDRNILILGILLLILLAVGYYFLLFSPLRQQYVDAYDERTQKEQQVAQLEQTVAELENVQRNAPEIERQILEYSKRIPEQDEIPSLVVQVEQVADGAGVSQLLIQPDSPTSPQNGGDFSVVPITMSFEGSYNNMQEFITGVRNLSRLVTINELTFCRKPTILEAEGCPVEGSEEGGDETTASASGEDILEVQISAETYVQPAAGGVPVTPPPGGGGTTASPQGGGTTGASGGGTT